LTDVLDLDDGQSPILSLLQSAVYEDNILKRLNATDTLISALEDNIADKNQAKLMRKYIHEEVLSNEDFMRRLKLFTRIDEHAETSIEYFGQDFLTHPEFHFDKEFISKLSEINKKLNHFIGTLIKEYSRGDQIEL